MRIERRRMEQLLTEIVFRHAAIRRNTKISSEQDSKGDGWRGPLAQSDTRQKQFAKRPDDSDLKVKPSDRRAVVTRRAKD